MKRKAIILAALMALVAVPVSGQVIRVITPGGGGSTGACALCLESDGTGWPITASSTLSDTDVLLDLGGSIGPTSGNIAFHDGADPTKKLGFVLSGITTATTRTVTWPDGNVTVPSGTLYALGTTVTGLTTRNWLTGSVNLPLLQIENTSTAASANVAAIWAAASGTNSLATGLWAFAATGTPLKASSTGASANPVVYISPSATHTGPADAIVTTTGAEWRRFQATELITLDTGGTTTNSSANLLPANSIIEAVVCRVTTTIQTATDWSVGDSTTAARFSSANATLAAGTTSVGLNHQQGSVSTDAAGPVQSSATTLRITTSGTPSAGAIRCTVFGSTFVAPTS